MDSASGGTSRLVGLASFTTLKRENFEGNSQLEIGQTFDPLKFDK